MASKRRGGVVPVYIISANEIAWGAALVAITLTFHGAGMILALYASRAFAERLAAWPSLVGGLGTLVLVSWIIVLVHCAEIVIWAAFFYWTGGMPNTSTAYYYALLQYTTVGSELNLPYDWRLLEGLTAIAGVLAFAWSTGVLLSVAHTFQDQQVRALEQRRQRHRPAHPGDRA